MQARSRAVKALYVLLILSLFAFFDVALNYTLYNPSFITPLYGFFLNHHVLAPESSGYPLEDIALINRGLYDGPRASVVGVVTDVLKSGDGDWHLDIKGRTGTIVVEIIPEYPLPVPEVGERVKIWGVTRYDIAHRWWELHPAIGWQKLVVQN